MKKIALLVMFAILASIYSVISISMFFIHYETNSLNIIFIAVTVIIMVIFVIMLMSYIHHRPSYMYKLFGKPTPEDVIKEITDFVFSLDKTMRSYSGLYFSGGCLDRIMSWFGWKYSGNGSFARVFISPCGQYALRISTSKHDSYQYYAQVAISNQQNKYMPKIYWHVSPISSNSYIGSVTLMENLSLNKKAVNSNNTVCSFMIASSSIWLKEHSSIDEIKQNVYPQLKEMVKLFIPLKKHSHQIEFDLHNENWMFRKNGEIVLTDPLC